MNIRPIPVLATVLATTLTITLAACGKGDDLAAAAESNNTLLAYVPEDTPYLAGNLEPIPEDVIEAAFMRVQPALDAVQTLMADTKIKISGSVQEENSNAAIMLAVLQELDGNFNREGLQSLGFNLQPNLAVYGMGVFPVWRISLSNAQALRETISRIQTHSGVDFPQHQFQEQAYWKLVPESVHAESDAPVSIYLAIIEEATGAHVAFGILPKDAESEFLPAFLGQVKPEANTAAVRLAEINSEYGYTSYGSGLLDFQRVFDQMVDPNSSVRQLMSRNGIESDDMLDEVCQAEVRSLIVRAPRMVAGATEMTPSAIGVQYRLELADDLATDLASLVANVPPAPAVTERMLEFAFGIRIGAARDFLFQKATELSQKTFECESLKKINLQAEEALVKLNYPFPPLVNNFLGVRAM